MTLLGIAVLALDGKARAQSRREAMLEARRQPADFRLAAQRIEWVENPELKINIALRDYAPTVTDQHQQTAQAYVRTMLNIMRQGAAAKVRETLESVNAMGETHLVRLRPVSGNVNFNRAGLQWPGSGLSVEVQVLDAAGQSLWQETLEASYGLRALARQTNADPAIVDALAERLLQRLRDVDLVAWR